MLFRTVKKRYVSFSKYINSSFTIRFIDTLRFMAPRFEKFRYTAKYFSTQDMSLVTRKGVYPYEYTDNWNKLEETSLPSKEDFYIWNHFNCQTLGKYSDLYLKIDVLLLTDVFENFRDLCLTTYHLDPSFFYTAPGGFSFDCMLKLTGQRLELIHDYDIATCSDSLYII
ncbi:Uncharacterized protein FWK35_00026209, partial [Aphis craccivora]